MDNLRHIGRAVHQWSAVHGSIRPACTTDYKDGGLVNPTGPTITVPGLGTAPNEGTFPSALRQSAWFQYLWLNGELGTPSVLACPGDALRRRATNFRNEPNGGLSSPNFQNSAVSYFVGLHATPEFPLSVLSGERHLLGVAGASENCALSGISAKPITAPNFPSLRWDTAVHDGIGNLLLNDGHVEEMSSAAVQKLFAQDALCVQHFIMP